MSEIKIREAASIRVDRIHPNEWNPNQQTESQLEKLAEEIREDGFDHPVNVVPCECDKIEEKHYKLIGGEHRWKVMRAEGVSMIPAHIHTDWDETKQKLKTVRRNLLTGELNARKFTSLVHDLKDKVDVASMPTLFGFDDEKEFSKFIIKDKDKKDKSFLDGLETESKKSKHMIESLTDIVSTILLSGTDTVDQNYLCFAYRGSLITAIFCDLDMVKALKRMNEHLAESGETATDFIKDLIFKELP